MSPKDELTKADKAFITGLLAGESLEDVALKLGYSASWGRQHMLSLRARFGAVSTAELIAMLTVQGKIIEKGGVCRVST